MKTISQDSRLKMGISQKERREKERLQRLKELRKQIYRYLSRHGPTRQNVLLHELHLVRGANRIMRGLILSYPEVFGSAQLTMGRSSGRANFRSFELFNGFSLSHKQAPIIYLKTDNKIIEFIGQRLPKPSTSGHLCSLSRRLRGIFGRELADNILFYVRYLQNP